MYHLLQIKLQLCCCGKITEQDVLRLYLIVPALCENASCCQIHELPKDTWGHPCHLTQEPAASCGRHCREHAAQQRHREPVPITRLVRVCVCVWITVLVLVMLEWSDWDSAVCCQRSRDRKQWAVVHSYIWRFCWRERCVSCGGWGWGRRRPLNSTF